MTKEAEKLKTEEVIREAPLERGETLIMDYTVVEHLRRGKDCDLYHLWSEERMTSCIGKTIQPLAMEKQAAKDRLIQEGEAITTLSHPNLIRGYALYTEPRPIVIQETLTGETISHLIRNTYKRNEELPLIQLAQFGKQIASVINYLHQNNIIHLDIKPSNIISQPPLAKLFDLNLATKPGTIRKGTGTKNYLSPEQATGEPLTTAADIWGIGVVLFFMATGKRPFKTYEDKRYEQLERDAEPVETLREMDPLLSDIINRCLDKNPDNRPEAPEIFNMCETYIQKYKD